MFSQRLRAFCLAVAALARNAGAAIWAGLAFIGAKLTALVGVILRTCVWVLHWLFIPKAETPLDVLKHYLSILFIGMGVLALAWAGKQILLPPLVITVMDLPASVKNESWLNPELPRTLLNEIERIRSVVKGDRDPAFEAVLNPPNVVIKTGEFSLNVQEQILTPLGSLLGFGQGEVHLALTCFHPNCARTTDSDCTQVIPDPKAVISPEKLYLCLRVTADIQRGRLQRRLTSRLALNSDTYQLEMTKQMTRIAEAVTSLADPVTAALYFYRRVREETAATRSVTGDPEVIAELRGEAFSAAEQAEKDAVSECWAQAVRAHLGLIRREFTFADIYIERARSIPWYQHWKQLTLAVRCQRLLAIADMEFARRLARSPSPTSDTPFGDETEAATPPPGETETDTDASGKEKPLTAYPPYEDDTNERRVMAAYERVMSTARRYGGNTTLGSLFGKSLDDDLVDALALAKSEIGLSWFTQSDQCRLLDGYAAPRERQPDPATGFARKQAPGVPVNEKVDRIRTEAWRDVQDTLRKLRSKSREPYPPLTRQAAMDFLERFAANVDCIEEVEKVAEQLFLNHPHEAKVAQLAGQVTEEAAMKVTRSLTRRAKKEDRGNKMLGDARTIYARMVDIGDDKSDVFALSRLAFITEAFLADKDIKRKIGPNPDTLLSLSRAWKRYQQRLYPTSSRHHAENIVAFWGSLLLRYYPKLTDIELSEGAARPLDVDAEEMRSALAQYTEFRRAWDVLFPGAAVKKLADLPQREGIGRRIGCLCMLSYATFENELADWLIANINKWQRPIADFESCKADIIPRFNVPRAMMSRNVSSQRRLSAARSAYDAAPDPKPPELKSSLESMERLDAAAKRLWLTYAVPRQVRLNRSRATEHLRKVRSALAAAGDSASVELQTALVLAEVEDGDTAVAIGEAEANAEDARESILKKLDTLKAAESACRIQPAGG